MELPSDSLRNLTKWKLSQNPAKIFKAQSTSKIKNKSSSNTNRKFIYNQSKTQKPDSENNGLIYTMSDMKLQYTFFNKFFNLF